MIGKPQHSIPALRLEVLPEPFFVVKMKPEEAIPPCLVKNLTDDTGRFFSLTRTHEEVSLVGQASSSMSETCKKNSGWMCIKIAGPMDFGLTGIMADFTAPLKDAKVPIFALSTW
ncbi:hypothetical protein HGRIS_008279 [Hohenbuehelia grisea]|uniref:CASTOR ACT domain-containing protein n=1 Tax=Hohenbuehelia grisea TaxID=104357 RepID=A0ABR3J7H6_9AGAR